MASDTAVYNSTAKTILKKISEYSSHQATKTLAEEMERFGEEVAEKARKYSEHADRKTIYEKDIRAALREMK